LAAGQLSLVPRSGRSSKAEQIESLVGVSVRNPVDHPQPCPAVI
jgi:hypothetical protein